MSVRTSLLRVLLHYPLLWILHFLACAGNFTQTGILAQPTQTPNDSSLCFIQVPRHIGQVHLAPKWTTSLFLSTSTMSADSAETATAATSSCAGPTATVLTSVTLHLSDSVAAAQPERIQLSPADWLVSKYVSTASLFFYSAEQWKQQGGGSASSATPGGLGGFMQADRLQASLQRLLDTYYPLLAGRFILTPDGCPEIDMTGAKARGSSTGGSCHGGIAFRTAKCVAALAELPLSPLQFVSPTCLPASLELVQPFDLAAPLACPPLQVPLLHSFSTKKQHTHKKNKKTNSTTWDRT